MSKKYSDERRKYLEERKAYLHDTFSSEHFIVKGDPNDFRFLPTAEQLVIKAIGRACSYANTQMLLSIQERVVSPDNLDELSQFWRRSNPIWSNQLRALKTKEVMLAYCDVLEQLCKEIKDLSQPEARVNLCRKAETQGYVTAQNWENISFVKKLTKELEDEINLLTDISLKWMTKLLEFEGLEDLGPTPITSPIKFADRFRQMSQRMRHKFRNRADKTSVLASDDSMRMLDLVSSQPLEESAPSEAIPPQEEPPRSHFQFPSFHLPPVHFPSFSWESLGQHWERGRQRVSDRWQNTFSRKSSRTDPIRDDRAFDRQVRREKLRLTQVLNTQRENPFYLFSFLPDAIEIIRTVCNPKTYRSQYKIVSEDTRDILFVSNQWANSRPEWKAHVIHLYTVWGRIQYCKRLKLILDELDSIIGTNLEEFQSSPVMTQLNHEMQFLWPTDVIRNLIIIDFNQILHQMKNIMIRAYLIRK